MFEYLPLKAGELIGRLSFSSSELGVYQYDLNLTATPAGSEAPVHFRTALGSSQSQTCRFVNFAKSKVEYSCKVITVNVVVREAFWLVTVSFTLRKQPEKAGDIPLVSREMRSEERAQKFYTDEVSLPRSG